MLYPKNSAKSLDQELFRHPTSEYRGAPFWAWNCELHQEELNRQLEILKKMGFGGAHMHVRSGMATPYLSAEYMSLIKGCVEKSKSEGMLSYLYDEDRWPSGAAGGLVTKDKRYRARHLLFTPTPYSEDGSGASKLEVSTAEACRSENGYLLARFDIQLDADGYLLSSRILHDGGEPEGEIWYAYLELATESPWYNNQTYIDTLSKQAMDRFIEVTYEAYNRTIPEDFGNTVPSIFTDEPQFTHKSTLRFATDKTNVMLPWTDDLAETFAAAYGEDLTAGIPELIWDRADRQPSVLRYHYHDHICERFAQAFADNCGGWCRRHGLALTGHMMEEPTLRSQTAALGEAMRSYRGFDIPGIDMLCAHFEYTTAKQAQSAVHQFGCEGMLSELYGVTNWDFDFRGHKLHGDWQAALGVTLRVPHLSWVSMAGEAKRDYPASINYQSPWWEKYPLIEDHFARLNTALTRGKPVVRLGVIHPVESYWLHWGPSDQTALERDELDQNFQTLTEWLLFGGIDFDFISESLLPAQCPDVPDPCSANPLQVGEMAYDAILIPGCETLRTSTLERLEAFAAAGGRLIFAGAVPTLENARPSDRASKLAASAICVPFSCGAILRAAEPVRMVDIRDMSGAQTRNLLTQLRRDGGGMWLFIAHGTEPYNKDVSGRQDLRIRVRGCWKASLWDTMTGEIRPVSYAVRTDDTDIFATMYDYDSLLIRLEESAVSAGDRSSANDSQDEPAHDTVLLTLPKEMEYSLSEPNVLLLDQAEWKLDGADWQSSEEILRLDNHCRDILGWPSRAEAFAQPWVVPAEPPVHAASLRWRICSDIPVKGAKLAMEDADKASITVNGQTVPSDIGGWYTDRSILTVDLPALPVGETVIEVTVPFGRRTNLEWAYLLGDFGTEVHGREVRLVRAPSRIAFGDFTSQGLTFYGGNLTYHIPVEAAGDLIFRSSQYLGALQTVSLDDGPEMPVIFPPYTLRIPASPGAHMLHLTLYGHRRNSFGPVHLADLKADWIGPQAWRTGGEWWCYDYRICPEGVLTTPVIETETDPR